MSPVHLSLCYQRAHALLHPAPLTSGPYAWPHGQLSMVMGEWSLASSSMRILLVHQGVLVQPGHANGMQTACIKQCAHWIEMTQPFKKFAKKPGLFDIYLPISDCSCSTCCSKVCTRLSVPLSCVSLCSRMSTCMHQLKSSHNGSRRAAVQQTLIYAGFMSA